MAAVASIGDKFYILGGHDLEDKILTQRLEWHLRLPLKIIGISECIEAEIAALRQDTISSRQMVR